MTPLRLLEHLILALFDNGNVTACDVCGLETPHNTNPIARWFRWFRHDMTVGWNRAHWSTYRWDT